MHNGLQVSVNFQPADALVPAGFVADVGNKFGDRGNGFSYGWNRSNTRYARLRTGASPGPGYLSHQDMYRSNGGTRWELAVPNATYRVRIVAGDPTKLSGMDYRISAEGVRILRGKPTSASRWVEATAEVTVEDGRLTLTNADKAQNNRISFLEVTKLHDKGHGPESQTVSVAAPTPRALERGPSNGTFRLSRAGDTSAELLVNYMTGGSATSGADFRPLEGSVLFPAGESDVEVHVVPLTDTAAEGEETVSLTLATSHDASYALGSAFAATVTIEDADQVRQPMVLKWVKAADAPIARSEAAGAAVAGKLYVFGGYVDSTYWPTRRADAFDPSTNTWTRLADLPVGLTHAATAVDGAVIYLVGGYPEGPRSQTFGTTAVFKYDTVKDVWSAMPRLPQARGGGAAALVGRELHYFGGSDLSRRDRKEHWSLNLDNLDAGWVARAPMTDARNHLGGVALGGRFYSLGGQTSQDADAVMRSEINIFDPVAAGWTTVASLRPRRSHIAHSSSAVQGRIITMGGEAQGGIRLATVSAYDPVTDAWAELTSLPQARKSGVGGYVGDVLVFTGGSNSGLHRATWIGNFA